MNALSEAIIRLLRRQEETDARLQAIEKTLGVASAPVVAAPPPPLEPEPPAPPTPAPPPYIEPEPPVMPAQPQLETTLGLTWVNRIGVLTLVLFVAFVFKYAVDSDWIGPAGRVLLGVLAGLGTLAAADFTWRRGQQVYAQGICGLGISILYLSFYSSFGFYHIVEPTAAFLLMCVTTAMAGALALRYNSSAIAALGMLGGYATPILLSTGENRPWAFFSYLLVLNVGALAVARFRNWRRIETLAFAATIFLYGGWFGDRFSHSQAPVATVFALAFYALFATSAIRSIALASQVLAALILAPIWPRTSHEFLWTSFAVLLSGMALADRRRWPLAVSAAAGGFWGAYALWMFSLTNSSPTDIGAPMMYLTAAFVVFVAWLPWRMLGRGAVLSRQDLLLAALSGALYFGAAYHLLKSNYEAYLGLFAAALGAVYLGLGYLLWNNLSEEKKDTRPVLLALGVALTFLTLAIPIQFGGYRITMAWSMEAAALAWIGVRTGSEKLRYATLLVLILVLFRLEGLDSWMYSSMDYRAIANARFLTFAIASAAFWASAYWLRTGFVALAAYLGGHFIMLWSANLEVIGWVGRTFAPENILSAESAGISIIMAAYALLLVGIGVATRTAVNRIAGLGLFAIVVAKLYLYDVWLLGRIYRIAAFGALGALLLITSYLYSRYRTAIENWWRDDPAGS